MILIYVDMSFRHRFLQPIVSPAYPVVSSRIVSNNNADGTIDSLCYRDWETDRKSTRLNSSHSAKSRMPSSA